MFFVFGALAMAHILISQLSQTHCIFLNIAHGKDRGSGTWAKDFGSSPTGGAS